MSDECIHLLNPAWCADCNGVAAQQKKDEEMRIEMLKRMGYFAARHPGKCCDCNRSGFFEPGTMVKYCTEHDSYSAECCAPAGEPA